MYDKTAALRRIDAVIAQGPYTDTWESLSGWQPPKWYRNAKFGIFIHWGVYSVPAFENEWYPRNMYIEGSKAFEHHVKTYGAHKDFGYKDFIPLFRAEKFDPAAWARSSGAPARGTWCRSRSTTTGSRCTNPRCPAGTPPRWGRSATLSAS